MFELHILNVVQQCYKISNRNKTESGEKEKSVLLSKQKPGNIHCGLR